MLDHPEGYDHTVDLNPQFHDAGQTAIRDRKMDATEICAPVDGPVSDCPRLDVPTWCAASRGHLPSHAAPDDDGGAW